MNKKKKFTKKHFLFIGIGIFFALTILGAFVDEQEQVAVSQDISEINSTSGKKTIEEEIAELRTEYEKCTKAIAQLEKENPVFNIRGKILDRERNSLYLRGSAFGHSDPSSYPLGTVVEGNILVFNPSQEYIRAEFYINDSGEHYFWRKGERENAYGAKVPIWVYGDEPLKLREARQALTNVLAKRKEIGTRYLSTAFVGKSNPPLTEDVAISKLEDFNISLANINSFKGVTIGSDRKMVESLTDIAEDVDNVTIFMFPQEGVLIMADKSSVLCLTYLLQADIVNKYYSFAKNFELTSSYKSDLPLDTPLISEFGYLREYKWTGYLALKSSLPELRDVYIKPTENNPDGNEYSFICRTVGEETNILSVSVYNLNKKRFSIEYLPLYLHRADYDPILGLQAVNTS